MDVEDESDIATFQLDLSLPPLQRWERIAAAYRQRFAQLLVENEEVIAELDTVPGCLAMRSLRLLPLEQQRDVRALSTLLEVPLRLLATVQLVYELFSLTDFLGGTCGCTTALKSCEEGTVHARTLDWSWLHGLDALLVNLDVRRGPRLLYRCTAFVGLVGALTGLRVGSYPGEAGGFTLSLNYRRPYGGAWQGDETDPIPVLAIPPLWRNTSVAWAAYHAMRAGWTVPSLFREVLETCDTFEEAHTALVGARLMAPCFAVLGGPHAHDGVIITRDAGLGSKEQALRFFGDVLCVANMDPHSPDLPSAAVVGLEDPLALGALGAKDLMMGESLLRRDFMLRLMGPDGDGNGVSSSPSLSETIQDFSEVVETVPIANEVTVHSTVMCAANATFLSVRSSGPELMRESGLCHHIVDEGLDGGLCMKCCFFGCKRKSAGANRSRRGEKRLGSLLRRRGGGYFCEDHLPLRAEDLSTR